jgi:hypothetical protein
MLRVIFGVAMYEDDILSILAAARRPLDESVMSIEDISVIADG